MVDVALRSGFCKAELGPGMCPGKGGILELSCGGLAVGHYDLCGSLPAQVFHDPVILRCVLSGKRQLHLTTLEMWF